MSVNAKRGLWWAVGVLVWLLGAAWAVAQPIASDPSLVTGQLEDGLTYVVKRHANPPGRATLWLHVDSGSLNETDKQRGLAHFLEHMAFNGSENFPPGTVVPLFESLGLTFGVHQNAFTSFDQTVYQLALPDTNPQTLEKGMKFLSDVALRLSLLPAEIDKERQIILEEKRSSLGARQRTQEYILARLAPGSTLGERIPIGTEESIQSLAPEDFREYYGRWYTPSNMTLLVVADADPSEIVGAIRQAFGGGAKQERPAAREVGVRPYEKSFAIVASDPELTEADVGFTIIAPPGPAPTTEQAAREKLVDDVGAWVFNRRLDERINKGKAAYLRAYAGIDELFRAATLSHAGATGEPGAWREMLRDLGEDLQRARLHGFSEGELGDARREMLASAERMAEVESTLPAGSIIGGMNARVADGEPLTSAAQRLELTKKLLPGITPAEVSGRFADAFDTRAVAITLEIPSSATVPTETELLEAGTAALAARPEKAAEEDRPRELMTTLPEPGKVVELSEQTAAAVWSAWLSNGVRMHFRQMDYRKDQVMVTISLAGGTIEETPENRGVSTAAALAWDRPATSKLTSTNIRDIMTGRKIGVFGSAGVDTMTLAVSGDPKELETGLQLAHLLLTDPVVEEAGFGQWKTEQKQAIAERRLSPEGVFGELLFDTILPKGEARLRELTEAQVDALSLGEAQSWLRGLIARAPIEVSVVGDIDREKATELVCRYVGSLARRDRIGIGTLVKFREIARPAGPLDGHAEVDTRTDKAVVLCGFFGTSARNVADVRLLNAAARILSTRMIKDIREEKRLVYSVGVSSAPGVEFPNYGMVASFATTAPGKVPALIEAIRGEFAAFAKEGPTEDEMTVVKKQIANTLDERQREPSYWSQVLATQDYHGVDLNDIVGAAAAYAGLAGADVREAFARYDAPAAGFTVWVAPRPVVEGDAPGQK